MVIILIQCSDDLRREAHILRGSSLFSGSNVNLYQDDKKFDLFYNRSVIVLYK